MSSRRSKTAAAAATTRSRGRSSSSDTASAKKKKATPAPRATSRKRSAQPVAADTDATESEGENADDIEMDVDPNQDVLRKQRSAINQYESRLRKKHKLTVARRPFYSSEEEEDERSAALQPSSSQTSSSVTLASSSSTKPNRNQPAQPLRSFQSRQITPASSHPSGDEHTQATTTTSQQRECLTHRIFKRPSKPPIKQWHMALAIGRGPTVPNLNRGVHWQMLDEDTGEFGPIQSTIPEPPTKPELDAEAIAAAAINRPKVPVSYSRPFDVRRPPDAALAASSSSSTTSKKSAAAATASSSTEEPERYWTYPSAAIKKVGKDPGYSVTNHDWYTDGPVERASPSLTLAELNALTCVPPGEACRRNGITFIREMRVKVKDETRAELNRVMKTVTGEIDRKVLQLCENGNISKCKVYQTDDYNYTLITTEKVLSREPICAWMGTLREKNTFAQRVGFETSLMHIWAYEVRAKELPQGYDGPDLVIDASSYGNESHFFRDPKWSHQQADANVGCRLVWNQKTGLPHLVFVALCDIAEHAELFLDWGDKCWKTVWNTQLTALATNSHISHAYLKSMQELCRQHNIDVLPQLAGSRFAIKPTPEDEAKEIQRQFLDEELSPFRSTSATTLEKKTPTSRATPSPTQKWPETSNVNSRNEEVPAAAVAATSSSDSNVKKETKSKKKGVKNEVAESSSSTTTAAAAAASDSVYVDMPALPRGSVSGYQTLPSQATCMPESPAKPRSAKSSDPHSKKETKNHPNAAAEATTTIARRTRHSTHLQIDTQLSKKHGDGTDSNPHSPGSGSTASSPYTPSFNTNKAFIATASHTMLTVFASALLQENLREIARVQRRLDAHRLRGFRKVKKVPKPLVQGAQHVFGEHAFELLKDPQQAFFKSGTRLGREAKVAVSDETKMYVAEAFSFLRPIDLPVGRDARLIREGNVPKAAVYEVVGMKHPARFFTRPDQTPFSLVAIEKYSKNEPIGAYIGVFRDFHQFHKASDLDAMKQVFAYDCHAQQIPGPPNPNLSPEEKLLPVDEQLAYRGGDLIVESLYYGNEIRFMNDCYGRSGNDGTVNAYATIAWDQDRQWPCILIRAQCPINKGDEIICDYGDSFWNKVARSLMMDHASYGDEVKLFIEDTEKWLKANGIPLPTPPRDRRSLPHLFTRDIQNDFVVYPKYFLNSSASDDEIATSLLTQEAASQILEASRARAEKARQAAEARRLEEEEKQAEETAAAKAAEAAAIAATEAKNKKKISPKKVSAKRGKRAAPVSDSESDSSSSDSDTMMRDVDAPSQSSTKSPSKTPATVARRGQKRSAAAAAASSPVKPTTATAMPPSPIARHSSKKRRPLTPNSDTKCTMRIEGTNIISMEDDDDDDDTIPPKTDEHDDASVVVAALQTLQSKVPPIKTKTVTHSSSNTNEPTPNNTTRQFPKEKKLATKAITPKSHPLATTSQSVYPYGPNYSISTLSDD